MKKRKTTKNAPRIEKFHIYFIGIPLFIFGAIGGTFISFNLIQTPSPPNFEEKAARLVLAKAKHVCVVNNQWTTRVLKPTAIEGKTYYTCCQMCKKSLSQESQHRTAIDPVTGKKIDKSLAVLGAHAEGRVVYFENEQNLEKFNEQME